MSQYVNIRKVHSSIIKKLRHAFFSGGSTVDRYLKIKDFPNVLKFLEKYASADYFDSIEILLMKGVVYKDGHPAYALFFDGNEENNEVVVRVGEQEIVEAVFADSPIILLSNNIINNKLLLETTMVHEVSHFIDGMPSGEDIAKKIEYNYLMSVYGMDTRAAKEFIYKKYE